MKEYKAKKFNRVSLEEPKSQVLPGFVRYVYNPEMCIFKHFGVFAILQSCTEYVQSCWRYCTTTVPAKMSETRNTVISMF